MHLIFCAHLIINLGMLNLDIIKSTPLLECLHCLFVCNLFFKQFHSFIFKLCIMILRFLLQYTTYRTHGGSTKHEKTEVARLDHEGMEPNHSDIWSGERIQVPPLPPSHLMGCSLIDIDYYIEVRTYSYYNQATTKLAFHPYKTYKNKLSIM